MVDRVRIACVLLVVLGMLAGAAPAAAQRQQFPSPLPQGTSGTLPGAPGPAATFDGTIQPLPSQCQPPPNSWDPYATPGAGTPTLLPSDPQFAAPAIGAAPALSFTTAQKFLQEIRLDYVWMPGKSSKEFGINDVGLTATFAIPFLYNPQTPLLVTPGFAIHYWSGPTGLSEPPFDIDLPPRVYDAYLDTVWNPQITQWLGGELDFRTGVYSDFRKLDSKSLRFTGSALAVLAFTPSFKLKAGVMYLDRNHIKLLPSGGVVWTPSADVRFDILFPNPKLSRRLTTIGTTEWWCYLRGEYGGGAWTIELPGDDIRSLDYNDMRVGVGLEFDTLTHFSGLFEVGVAFEREIFFREGPTYPLNTTVYVRGGLAY